MDLQAIGLFKLIVVAGLAFFSYRKTKAIQDNNLAIRHQSYQPTVKHRPASRLSHPKDQTQLSTSAVSARTLDLQDCRHQYQHIFKGSIYEEKSEEGQEGSQKGSCIEQIIDIEKQEEKGQLEMRSDVSQVQVDEEIQQQQKEVLRSKTERPRKKYDFKTFILSHAKKAPKPPKKKIFKSHRHE